MEKRVMDFTPFLHGDEKVLTKQRAEKSNGVFVELAICFILLLASISAHCFLLGAVSRINSVMKDSTAYMFVLAASLFISIVPFGAWMFSIMKRISPLSDKWYAITNKRIAVIGGTKPVNVTYLDFSDVTSVTLGNNKVIVKFGEEKLVLGGLAEADAEIIYDVLEKTLVPEPLKTENVFAERPETTTGSSTQNTESTDDEGNELIDESIADGETPDAESSENEPVAETGSAAENPTDETVNQDEKLSEEESASESASKVKSENEAEIAENQSAPHAGQEQQH